jgi:phospholipase C
MPGHWVRRASLAALAVALIAAAAASAATASRGSDQLSKINHIVVIYEENHSFDNLYGGWEGVNGIANADAAHTTQVDQAGSPFGCLLQNDVNLTSPPLSVTCTDAAHGITSHFTNNPFSIEQYIPRDARTCPQPGVFAPNGLPPSPSNLPGGCTRDIVHRFYQEQYQLNKERRTGTRPAVTRLA